MFAIGWSDIVLNAPWLVVTAIALLLGAEINKGLARRRRRRWKAGKVVTPGAWADNGTAERPFDPAQQLRAVENASFSQRPLLNGGETRLLAVIDRIIAEIAPECRAMAQVSLGEILASPSPDAYRAINSKRVDLLIVGAEGYPLHAIEFQGSGHHLGPAATRDAVKKEALRKAGIGYIEVMAGDTPSEVRAKIIKIMRAQAPAVRSARIAV